MPLVLTTPEVVQNDMVRVEAFTVSAINDPAGPTVTVSYTKGLEVDSVYESRSYHTAVVMGAPVAAAMLGAPVGSTVYAVIKKVVYDLLQTEGFSGVVA